MEVKLSGRVAKNSTDEVIYELSSLEGGWSNVGSRWASMRELSIVSKRMLDGTRYEEAQRHDHTYLSLLDNVLNTGEPTDDRTGTGTISTFSKTMTFDLSDGTIPLLTTKKMHIPSILHEIIWYISGSSNIQYLRDNNVRIWNEWATEDGELGNIYGPNWRNWKTSDGRIIDQLEDAINTLKNNPNSRRIIVESWNPEFLPDDSISPQENVLKGKGALPPCHKTMQFSVKGGKLNLMMYQRSADMFLGVPFNIAQYGILLHIISHLTAIPVGSLHWVGGDVHIYNNHFAQVTEQLSRTPFNSPKLKFSRNFESIDDLKFEDMHVVGYESHSLIPAKVST